MSIPVEDVMKASSEMLQKQLYANGARNFTVGPWMINEGTVTIRLDSSSQTFTVL